jgi:hypothetical protein
MELTGLYRQLEQQCNLAPIKELLRDIKSRSAVANSDVQIGSLKEDAIRNLEAAVNCKHATTEEVQQLLWNSEETGHQHVLLMTPAPDDESPLNMDGTAVAKSLFGVAPLDSMFPSFDYPERGHKWVDFRLHEGTVRDSWLAKAYGLELVRASLGQVTMEDIGDGRIQEIREFTYREIRTVLVARWRSVDRILELRVDSNGLQNQQTLPERREAMWELLAPAFSPDQFIGVDIDSLLGKLVFERAQPENASHYSISRIELTDPRSGQIKVVPHQSEEFDKDPGRTNTLAGMQKHGFKPSSVRIDWKSGAAGAPESMKEPVSIVLAKTENGPELRILKRLPREVYEYVFGQLRSRLRKDA